MNSTRFIGRAQTAIDEKGRTSFPREFRRQLEPGEGENLVVTKFPGHALKLYVYSKYEEFLAELESRPDRRQADNARRFLDETLVSLDAQNRILLPKRLIDYAGFEGEVLYVPSHGKTLELWNPATFEKSLGETAEDFEKAFEDAIYGLTEGSGASE